MQKELLLTQDLKYYNQVCELLTKHNIRYFTRVIDRKSAPSSIWSVFGQSRRNTQGLLFEDKRLQLSYSIYVDRKNYSLARSFLSKY